MAVLAVADALAQGHDPRVLGAAFLDSLRDAFLMSLGVEVPHLMEHDREQYGRWATELGTPALTRAMEAVGSALVEMRQAADPRVPLEVALVRLTSAQDTSLAGLVDRIERLEQALAAGEVRRPRRAPHRPLHRPPAPAPTTVRQQRRHPLRPRRPPRLRRPRPPPSRAARRRPSRRGGGPAGPAQARAELARLARRP